MQDIGSESGHVSSFREFRFYLSHAKRRFWICSHIWIVHPFFWSFFRFVIDLPFPIFFPFFRRFILVPFSASTNFSFSFLPHICIIESSFLSIPPFIEEIIYFWILSNFFLVSYLLSSKISSGFQCLLLTFPVYPLLSLNSTRLNLLSRPEFCVRLYAVSLIKFILATLPAIAFHVHLYRFTLSLTIWFRQLFHLLFPLSFSFHLVLLNLFSFLFHFTFLMSSLLSILSSWYPIATFFLRFHSLFHPVMIANSLLFHSPSHLCTIATISLLFRSSSHLGIIATFSLLFHSPSHLGIIATLFLLFHSSFHLGIIATFSRLSAPSWTTFW